MASTQINSEKFFLTNLLGFLIYVLNPRFLLIIAGLIGLGSIIFIAPFTGALLNLLIFAMSFKFAVDILLTASEGSFEPKDVYFSGKDYTVVVQMIVIGIILDYLTDYAASSNNSLFYYLIIYGLQFIMPAIYMVLAYSGSLLEALNPMTLIRFIKPWFVTYVIFSLFYLFTVYLEFQGIYSVLMNVASFKAMYVLSAFISIFFLFLNFNIMGFLIYQNFDIEDDSTEVRTTGSKLSEHPDQQDNKPTNANPIYARIQNLIETQTTAEAIAIINELQKDGDNSAELLDYKQQVLMIVKNKIEVPINEKIHNYIVQNKVGTAFRLLEEIYANKESYLEASESDLGILAKHAFSSEKFPLVIKLLNGFNKNYPNSQEVVTNYYLIAQVLYKNPKTQGKALAILNGLIKKYPNHAKIPEIKSWAKGIELMQK